MDTPIQDSVSDVMKWVLIAVALVSFGICAWATVVTSLQAPPEPNRFLAANGTVLMTTKDIEDGKASFQRADLMDYGSIYGMGSYFGEDYTAKYVVSIGELTVIALNFFLIGWAQLEAVYVHGFAYARSLDFYRTTLLWQWLRFVGDVPFAVGALLMALDFILKLGPMFPALAGRVSAQFRESAAD